MPLILVLFFAAFSANSPAEEKQEYNEIIYFGLLPYLSSSALFKAWRPLADYIEETLGKRVIIKTAPNFKTFLQRTKAGRYDLLMTAPHFAALAVRNDGYRIIAGHSNDLAGDIIVAKTSRFQSIGDLRGKVFAIPGRLAAVSMLAELLLERQGLKPNADITIKVTATHNAALIAVAEGQADAAVAVGGLYRRLNASNKFGQLRRLTTTDKIPHVMYIAGPSFAESDIQKLRRALIQPVPGTSGAQAIADLRNNFNGGRIDTVSPQRLQRLAPILSLLESKTDLE